MRFEMDKRIKKIQDYINKFWGYVDKKGDDECWEWKASCFRTGYGQFGTYGLGKQKMTAHRFSWFIHYGEFPKSSIDHKCQNKKCVNPNHLRLATDSQNMAYWPRKKSKSGFRGVYKVSKTTWTARLIFQGKLFLLGNFKSPEEAYSKYCEKAKELFGEFAELRQKG